MQILVLLGMYFDAVVVFVTRQTLLFRLALAILSEAKVQSIIQLTDPSEFFPAKETKSCEEVEENRKRH